MIRQWVGSLFEKLKKLRPREGKLTAEGHSQSAHHPHQAARSSRLPHCDACAYSAGAASASSLARAPAGHDSSEKRRGDGNETTAQKWGLSPRGPSEPQGSAVTGTQPP